MRQEYYLEYSNMDLYMQVLAPQTWFIMIMNIYLDKHYTWTFSRLPKI